MDLDTRVEQFFRDTGDIIFHRDIGLDVRRYLRRAQKGLHYLYGRYVRKISPDRLRYDLEHRFRERYDGPQALSPVTGVFLRQAEVPLDEDARAYMAEAKRRGTLGKERYAFLMEHHPHRFVPGQWLVIALDDDLRSKRIDEWVAVARNYEDTEAVARARFPDRSCYMLPVRHTRRTTQALNALPSTGF